MTDAVTRFFQPLPDAKTLRELTRTTTVGSNGPGRRLPDRDGRDGHHPQPILVATTSRYSSSTSPRCGPPTELTVNESDTTASLIARIVFA